MHLQVKIMSIEKMLFPLPHWSYALHSLSQLMLLFFTYTETGPFFYEQHITFCTSSFSMAMESKTATVSSSHYSLIINNTLQSYN